MLAPRMTRPVLMKYSVRTASRSQSGTPMTLLMKSPMRQGEDHVLESPVADGRVPGEDLGEPREHVHDREPEDISADLPAEQRDADRGHEQEGQPDDCARLQVLGREDAAEGSARVTQALRDLRPLPPEGGVLDVLRGRAELAGRRADLRATAALQRRLEGRRGRCQLPLACGSRARHQPVDSGSLCGHRARDRAIRRPLELRHVWPHAGKHQSDDCQPEPRREPVLAPHDWRPGRLLGRRRQCRGLPPDEQLRLRGQVQGHLRRCAGWRAHGRGLSVMADALSSTSSVMTDAIRAIPRSSSRFVSTLTSPDCPRIGEATPRKMDTRDAPRRDHAGHSVAAHNRGGGKVVANSGPFTCVVTGTGPATTRLEPRPPGGRPTTGEI